MQTLTDSTQDWTAARMALLERERALTRDRDALAEARRALPALRLSKSYTFEGPDGRETLADLFGPHSQLIVYHFMFGPDWDEGCPSCSFWADNLDGIDTHLAQRDVSFVMVSTAPYATVAKYKTRMGWRFKWLGDAGAFNRDMGVSFTPEQLEKGENTYNYGLSQFNGPEAPGLTVFRRDGDEIALTYASFARGLDWFNGAYQLLDLAPKGRDEADLPWPMAWVKRHDQYD